MKTMKQLASSAEALKNAIEEQIDVLKNEYEKQCQQNPGWAVTKEGFAMCDTIATLDCVSTNMDDVIEMLKAIEDSEK